LRRRPGVSIVIPTYRRRDVLVRMIKELDRQVYGEFEVVVVVDGSTDGTSAALRHLALSFPLALIEQANSGAAAARNAGAAAATGELLLFLDDDMAAHPRLLVEHVQSHADGADIVLGHVPLHRESPMTVLSKGVERWAERRRERLAAFSDGLPGVELLTGQMSISKTAFQSLGGFDVSFTRHGLFGGEDRDFGVRAFRSDLRIVFNERAISYQLYAVDPSDYTRRSAEAGRAAVELKAKHPGLTHDFTAGRTFTTRPSRAFFGLLGLAPPVLSRPLRALAEHRVRSGRLDRNTYRLFFALQTMEYQRGSRLAERALRTECGVVLAYHAICDLSGDPVVADYGVPPQRFAEHLDLLSRTGRSFVSLASMVRALDGGEPLPPRAILVTFDDAYADLLTTACPILTERGIHAAVFVVAGMIGGTNDWDRAAGARELALLDADGIRAAAALGIAVGSHGLTHQPLVELGEAELNEELVESADRLAALGLPKPLAFSYPYGRWNAEVVEAVRAAGYAVAFTTRRGVVRRDVRYALPRVEVLASDTARAVWLKVVTAHWPDRWRRRLLRLLGVGK
jgi:GT2 family glycosyltransferase/peptidoglycan/xylan/chitin deacetylase (PgdA/CDA1 family)